ncbi:MAG: aminotransferase class I/II-fold pyridoxal phosphate-dependent enzyme [Bacteroidales bacterium]
MSTPKINPASRLSLVQEYYFSGKLKEIADMRRKGLDAINLGIGSPDLPPSSAVIDTLYRNASNPSNHGYQSYNGIPALRNALAGWYKTYFHADLDPASEILPLIGSKEGIMHISMAFLDPGDEVLIPNPGYPAYEAATKLTGGKVRYYDLTEENGWLPDTGILDTEDLSHVKIMWINYPNMPTGRKASVEIFRNLIAFARRHSFLLINDNPYSFILNDNPLSILSVENSKDVALELNSLSKSHNMAGWRIGMVGGDAAYISAIMKVKSNMDSGMFQPLQAAAAAALEAPPEWYRQLNEVYLRRRVIAGEIMDALSCTFERDQAGLFLWGRIPEYYTDAAEMTDALLYDRYVFITPGLIFGSNGNRYIRISLCAPEDVLKAALDRVKIPLKTINI